MFMEDIIMSNPDLFWGLVAGSSFALGFTFGAVGVLYFMSKSQPKR